MDTHSIQFCGNIQASSLTVVRDKTKRDIPFHESVDKPVRSWDETIPSVDHSIHINKKCSFHCLTPFNVSKSPANNRFKPRLLLLWQHQEPNRHEMRREGPKNASGDPGIPGKLFLPSRRRQDHAPELAVPFEA
jgi:hypothetical protein